ncbi:MAG: tetraacyldisaccharide 4'-kinase [Desulfobacterium sp.]|nr:tetraacyldisaccharide 4'-kinase [Desulfobacterium sp.]
MSESLKRRLTLRIEQISATDFNVRPFSFQYLLVILSRIYGWVVGARSVLYARGILKSKKLACPVISIGNIVAGGSGKTPMAIYIAELVKEMGYNPVVVSRGYGGTLESDTAIVGNGDEVFLLPSQAGDEPFMMAMRRSFPVVVGKDRYRAGLRAIAAFDPDVILLDDGFQHLKLQRDLDIVLLDAARPFGNGRLLPAGRLRELPGVIGRRGGLVVFTRCEKIWGSSDDFRREGDGRFQGGTSALKKQLKECLSAPRAEKAWFMTCHIPFLHCLKPAHTRVENRSPTLDLLSGRQALLFSGISDNQGFKKSVEQLGAGVKGLLEFPDHHMYNRLDIETIKEAGIDKAVDLLITTEKDYARLDRDLVWPLDLVVIGIGIEFVEHVQLLKDKVKKVLR